MPSSRRGANTLIKRHLWLPMIIALFLIKGKAAKAQDAGAIDFDQECVNSCFGGFQTALQTFCPGGNEENGVYDCAATSCDWTKEAANMYMAGYLIQSSKANNTFCAQATQTSAASQTASAKNATASGSLPVSASARVNKTSSAAQPVQTGPGAVAPSATTTNDPSATSQKASSATCLAGSRNRGIATFAMLLVTAAFMSLL